MFKLLTVWYVMTSRSVCIVCVTESSFYSFVLCEVSVMADGASLFKFKPKPHSGAPSEELMVVRMLT
jgi:hypothetical protein